MIHTNTKIIAVISMFVFVVCIIITTVFVRKVEIQKSEYTARLVERAEMRERERSLESLTQALADTKAERESLTARILPEDVISFLAFIEDLGREQGVKLVTSSLTVKPIDAVFENLVLSIEVRGTYTDVIRVVSLFEYLPYQSSLNTLRISRENGENNWRATFMVEITKFKKV